MCFCLLAVTPAYDACGQTTPSGPSFSCAGVLGEIETAICRNPALASEDADMAALYKAAQRDSLNIGPSGQLAMQRKFLKGRADDCANEAWKKFKFYARIDDCIRLNDSGRVGELEAASLFTAPDRSLAVLKARWPNLAPVYEGLYSYVTIADKTERVRTVTKIIAPTYAKVYAMPGSLLRFYKVTSPEVAASSDDAFGVFFDSALVAQETSLRLPMPCEALIRRPGLTAALGPKYGGAIDGDIPDSDCDTMLPKIAPLDKLATAAWKAEPFCPGTIRFSSGRGIAMLTTAIRLHQPQYWRRQTHRSRRGRQDLTTQTSAARVALAKSYVEDFHVEPAQADEDARTATDALLYAIANFCS